MTRVPDVLRRANEAGVTLHVSGAEMTIGGNVGELSDDLREELDRLQTSGFLWDWCGAAVIDREAVAFANSLGVEVVLVETDAQAISAVEELSSDAADGRTIGLDTETALKPEFAPPRRPILVNADGTLSERNRFEEKPPKGEPKPWRDPHLAAIRLLQLHAGRRCFVFRGRALELVLKSRFIHERPLVAHNAAFETSFLLAAGIERDPLECTMQGFGLLYGTMNRSLARAAAKVLGIAVPKALETSDWAAKKLSWGQVCYASTDAVLAFRLWRTLLPMLHSRDRFTTYRLQRDAQPAIAAMERRGMGFDKGEHARQVEIWSREFAEACGSFKSTTGKPPPIKRADLQAWIGEVATPEQLDTWPKTKTDLSVAADCIKWLILNDDPTVPLVLDILARKKLIESFGPNLPRFVSPVTDRIHAAFNIGRAETGRFSSDTPNLQQLPSKGAGRDFRRCITAADGCLLVCGDFSQVELRIAAWRFKDQAMTRAFADGEDTHARTVRLLGFDEVTPERRSLAKAINFGCIYGMSERGLVEYAWSKFGIQMMVEEARGHLNRFFAVYHGIHQGRFDIWNAAKASGVIPAGRYGRVVEKPWVQRWVEGGKPPFTMCANFPISGAASDLMLACIPPVDRRLGRLRGGLILTVHDELVAEVHRDDAEAAKAALEEEMTWMFVKMFPGAPADGVVEAKIGRNWLEAKA
jgi:DNA polymerase I